MVNKWLGAFTGFVVFANITLAQAPQQTLWAQPETTPPSTFQLGPPSPLPSDLTQPTYLVPAPANGAPTQPQFWFQAEYLIWWLKNNQASVPVIFAAFPSDDVGSGGLSGGSAHVENDPARFSYGAQSGFRLSTGYFFDDAREWGADASWLQFGTRTHTSHTVSDGGDEIGPVIVNSNTGFEDFHDFSIPGKREAELDSLQQNRLWGLEANVSRQVSALLFADRLDFFTGFRYLQFTEDLDTYGHHDAIDGYVDPVAQSVTYTDHFGVENNFYGWQFGLRSHTDIDIFTVDLIGKLALGGVDEYVNINGSTTVVSPNPNGPLRPNVTQPGGFLTQPTNIGRYHEGNFAVVPEFIGNVGCQLFPWLRATVGYDFLYVNNLLRVGNQIDQVDSRQVYGAISYVPGSTPTSTSPTFQAHTGGVFWAQGLTFGLEFAF